MIQLKQVMDEISIKTRDLNDNLGGKKGVISRIQGQLSFLKLVVSYLETGPSDDFLKQEINRLEARYTKIMEHFPVWTPTQYFEKEKDRLKEFQKINDLPKLKLQMRALRYISQS
jgi:hypothetical protein